MGRSAGQGWKKPCPRAGYCSDATRGSGADNDGVAFDNLRPLNDCLPLDHGPLDDDRAFAFHDSLALWRSGDHASGHAEEDQRHEIKWAAHGHFFQVFKEFFSVRRLRLRRGDDGSCGSRRQHDRPGRSHRRHNCRGRWCNIGRLIARRCVDHSRSDLRRIGCRRRCRPHVGRRCWLSDTSSQGQQGNGGQNGVTHERFLFSN
jgi:hypothetical protein